LAAAGDAVAPGRWHGGEDDDVVTLVLWRHGQTTYNVQRRFQGQSDVPLNEVGRRQAADAAGYLAALRPSAIYSSDLSRASATAGALARLTGLPVQLDKDLRERGGGCWEGLTEAEIRERFPAERLTWSPPDGEPAAAVADRASAALTRIADSVSGGSMAVVVSHGAALGMATARLLDIPWEPRVLGPFGNCRWSVLSRRRIRWRLLEHNVGMLPEPVPDGGADDES
jgi:glucosyl-3-phosphoglycerate phosphatase